jgi:hypothetical protein
MVVFDVWMRLFQLPSLGHFYFLVYNRMNQVAVETVQIQPGTALLITCAACGETGIPVTPSYVPITPEIPEVNNPPPSVNAAIMGMNGMSPLYSPQTPLYSPPSPQYGMDLSPVYSPYTPVYASPNSVNASQLMNVRETGGMTSYGRSPISSRSRSTSGRTRSSSKRSKKSKTTKKPRRNERR